MTPTSAQEGQALELAERAQETPGIGCDANSPLVMCFSMFAQRGLQGIKNILSFPSGSQKLHRKAFCLLSRSALHQPLFIGCDRKI